MFCQYCGEINQLYTKFCEYCGKETESQIDKHTAFIDICIALHADSITNYPHLFCEFCGKSNQRNARFCEYCGKETESQNYKHLAFIDNGVLPHSNSKRYCSHCGELNANGGIFCKMCGQDIRTLESNINVPEPIILKPMFRKRSVVNGLLFGPHGQFSEQFALNMKASIRYLIITALLAVTIFTLGVIPYTNIPGYSVAVVTGALLSVMLLRKNQNGAIREKSALLCATTVSALAYLLAGGQIYGGYVFALVFIISGYTFTRLRQSKPNPFVWFAEIIPCTLILLLFERLGGAISGFGAKHALEFAAWTWQISTRYYEVLLIFVVFVIFQWFAHNAVAIKFRKIAAPKLKWFNYTFQMTIVLLFLFIFINPIHLPVFNIAKSAIIAFSQPASGSADVLDINDNKIGRAVAIPRVNPILSRHIPGYMATAYEFSYVKNFNKANIKFEYDAGLGEIGENFQPRIYYFNESDGTLEELPNQEMKTSSIRGWASVTATIEHFSTYILLNSVEFNAVWTTEIRRRPVTDTCPCNSSSAVRTNAPNFDVVFVIDESGSMNQNDPNNLRVEATIQFIDMLATDSKSNRVSIYGFENSARTILNLTALSNKDAVKISLNTIHSGGGTNIYSGLSAAVQEIEKNNKSYTPVIILMTDGQDNSNISNYQGLIDSANEKGLTIFAIGLGNDVNATLLREICNKTGGGVYYYAKNSDLLPFIFKSANTAIIDYAKDSNGDGISDYYAKLLYDGTLRLSNGSGQFIGVDLENSDDIDGDGLKNGEELVIAEKIIHGTTQVFVTMRSDPTKKNSMQNDIDSKNNCFTYSGGDIANKETGDYTTGFTFSTEYFNEPANKYNHDLSTMSLELAVAAFGLHKEPYGITKANNIRCLLSCMGFQDVVHYGYEKEPTSDSIAATIARMSLKSGHELLVIAVRGGEYKSEWGGNFKVGNGDVHEGFELAANQVKYYFDEYLSRYMHKLSNKNLKLWITGYSRGSAVANLLGAYFVDETKKSNTYTGTNRILSRPQVRLSLKRTDIYIYGFATPNVSKKAKSADEDLIYNNIFYIISPFDPVPRFPFSDWGFKKYGKEVRLPDSKTENYKKLEENMLQKLNGLNSSFNSDAYQVNKFRVHKGNTGTFHNKTLNPLDNLAIYDLGPHDEGRGAETMDEYLNHLINKTLYTAFGTQGKYLKDNQDSAVAGAQTPNPDNPKDVKGFMGAITANGVLNKITIGTGNWLDASTWGRFNDDIATLGPSDEHLRKLVDDGDDNVGKLKEEDRFPAVYNFDESSKDLNFNDGYDRIMKEKGLKTRKQAVQEGAKEAKNNSKAITSGHYPELYLAWLRSLPKTYFQNSGGGGTGGGR